MGAFDGPDIKKGDGNLGGLPPNKERVLVLVAGGVATNDLPLDTPVRILHPSQAEALGINAAYDANNDILVYDDIVECFRLSPETELIFMLTAQPDGSNGNELKDWFDADGPIEAVLRNTIGKDIKAIFTRWNAASGYNPSYSNYVLNAGLCDEVKDCFAPAQALVDRFFAEFRYIDSIELDGWAIDDEASLDDLREENYPDISINLSVDGYLETNYPDVSSHVAVGAAMGMFAVRQINENTGSVEVLNPPSAKAGQENYPLDNGIRWPYAALPNGKKINTLTAAVVNDISDKAYIIAGSFPDYPGIYFSGDPTAVASTSDYRYRNNNCVWNAAARLARQAMIPKTRSVLKKNPATGFITGTSAEALRLRGQNKVEQLVKENKCSAVGVFLDPNQTPSDTTPIKARIEVVKDGILHSFEIDLGLFNQISAQ
jgi:hypothetical protein